MESWEDSEYLMNSYNDCVSEANMACEFGSMPFEIAFEKCIKPFIEEWTVIDRERKILLTDMLDRACDERIK